MSDLAEAQKLLTELSDELADILQPFFKKWAEATSIKPHMFTVSAKGEHGALYGTVYIEEQEVIEVEEGTSLDDALKKGNPKIGRHWWTGGI